MALRDICKALADDFKGSVIKNIPLAVYTTFRIGGPADLLVIPKGMDDLMLLAQTASVSGVEVQILGRGSNVLVSDGGFHGMVVVLGEGLERIKLKGKNEVNVEAGCDLSKLIAWSMKRGLGGLEDLSGIPGTVGGAVRMNAGAMGSSMGDMVEEVSLLGIDAGEAADIILDKSDVGFGYRRTDIGDNEIIYKVKLKLDPEDGDVLRKRHKEVLGWRRDNQPLKSHSAGSVFLNPPECSAGELIDRCGLKGCSVGDAVVSDQHANFILNVGNASAEDVYKLITHIKREVRLREGIDLEEEIRLIGEIGRGR
ncbi:MAG: UDP-N-acetylmuramate dehydrogenase [Actinomycetota bacterium]|nr:UDP-N-acetylmuramate dehydrogenase [Actinomycetota bacterium]